MKKLKISGCLGAVVLLILIAAGAYLLVSRMRENINDDQQSPSKTNKSSEQSDQNLAKFLPLGNPSYAAQNENVSDNYLILGDFSTISYNEERGQANWVMWKLTKEDFGKIERRNEFRPDDRLPHGWKRITSFDYNGSGYDRGHMCPSGDRTSTVEANTATFVMSNMAPQTNDLNAGPWEKLESYTRSLAWRNMTLYIATGGYGESHRLRNKVSVPTNFWKIIAVVPKGGKIDKSTRIIAVDMPNIEGIEEADWRNYRTTIREIEQKTKFDFFNNFPIELQDILEKKLESNSN